MRKKILFFLAILGCFFISACGNEESEEDTNKPNASVSPKATIKDPEAPAPPPNLPKAIVPDNSETVAPSPPPSESKASTSPEAAVSDPEAPAPPPAPIEKEPLDTQTLTDL